LGVTISERSFDAMSDSNWKQAVAERILQIVNDQHRATFSIDEVNRFLPTFSALFPNNRHVREKVRQILQRLRDDGFLIFHGEGYYELNLAFDEIETEPVPLNMTGTISPETKQVVRNIRLRSTLLGAEIKRRYKSICQACRIPVPISTNRDYAEAHHLWPIGSPHFGPDVPGNIVVVCPNHHAMFDRGAITIDPTTLKVRHIVPGVFSVRSQLYLEDWHSLGQKYLQYHHHKIFEKKSFVSD